MDKLRVGLIVNQHYQPHSGGAYSYFNILLRAINDFEFPPEVEVSNIVFFTHDVSELGLKKPSIYIPENFSLSWKFLFKNRFFRQLNTRFIRKNPLSAFVSASAGKAYNKKVNKILKQNKIDLVYYLNPVDKVLNYPFITTHWDVGHRSTFPFPEISMDGNYESRENYYSNVLNKALMIICESEAGAKELNSYYQFLSKKIKVLPLFGGSMVKLSVTSKRQERILSKYDLEKDGFFVYPAQFWPHKNHYNLIKAFYKFRVGTNFRHIRLVLCGSDKGNLKYIREVISFLKLDKSIVLAGFVSDEELYAFYSNARALVMPTFLGPTNLPVIEAPGLKCPVLCSDLEGHREILGENALFFDPQSTESIEQAMEKIMDDEFRKELSQKAFEHINKSPFNIENSLQALDKIFQKAMSIRKTWGAQ